MFKPSKKMLLIVTAALCLFSFSYAGAQDVFSGDQNSQSGGTVNFSESGFTPDYVNPSEFTEPSVFVNPSNTTQSQTGNVATTNTTVTTTSNVSTGNVGCPTAIRNISQFFTWFMCVATKLLIPLLVTAALGLFIYGVVTYFINADNSEKRREGSKFMIWGIVALFVMVSVWALVGVLANTFGLDYTTRPPLPIPKL